MDKATATEHLTIARPSDLTGPNLLTLHGDTLMAQKPAGRTERTEPVDRIDFSAHGDIYKSAPIETKGNVSYAFRESARNWWVGLPNSIQELATKGGIKVIVAGTANDVMPNADTIQARGHKRGETYGMMPGFYYPQANALVLVEHHQLTPEAKLAEEFNARNGVRTFKGGVETVIASHELGHALDYQSLGMLSQSKAFAEAYNADAKRVLPNESTASGYYTQPDKKAAKEEVLAEVFAVMNKPMQSQSDRAFLARFSKVAALMRAKGLN